MRASLSQKGNAVSFGNVTKGYAMVEKPWRHRGFSILTIGVSKREGLTNGISEN